MMVPRIYVISGPSGAGKTTLLNRLFRKKFVRESFIRTISFTTRSKRKGEREGRDYVFVSHEQFKKLIRRDFFLEYQKVLDDYYGTPRYFINQARREKKDLILCIDVKGGMYLKKKVKRDIITTIFVSVPDRQTLYRRLRKRAEAKKNIEKRINLAKKELQFIKDYDYLIINQDLAKAVKTLEAILIAERARIKR